MKFKIAIIFFVLCSSLFAKPIKIMYFNVTGGIGDYALQNDITKALSQLGVDYDVDITNMDVQLGSKMLPELKYVLAGETFDIIITNTEKYNENLIAYAKTHPKTYIFIMNNYGELPKNMTTFNTDFRKASFFAGATAAYVSKTNAVAYLGVKEPIPLVLEYYKKGVLYAKPNAKIIESYITSNNPNAGIVYNPEQTREIVTSLAKNKVDVIFNIAKHNSYAVIDVARERHIFLIMAGIDNNFPKDKNIIGGIYFNIFTLYYDAIKNVIDKKAVPNIITVSLENNGLVSTVLDDDNKSVNKATKAKLKEFYKKLVANEIDMK